ncbi:hypothetical protein GOP47_0022027 [Adiantum capillus-veneris]|uniref:Uncharacterized protein n=1 Tax=Adiantum capillus-veneris TaxID=13818 RepID=A0A9D4U972_ADICA|nr:hypothetical protein GOP47_0022027 [Adiantum capillus-veneris]
MKELKQKDMDIEAYAIKMLSMKQRVEKLLQPSIRQVENWFIRGLNPKCHAAVTTKQVENEDQLEELIEETKVSKRRALERKKKKTQKPSPEKMNNLEESTSSELDGEKHEKSKKEEKGKRKWKEKMLDLFYEMKKVKQ